MLHQIRACDLDPGSGIDEADPDPQIAVAVDDVVSAATCHGIAAGATDEDVAGAEDRTGDRAEARRGGLDDRRRILREGLRHDGIQAVDAIDAGLVEDVAAGGAAHGAGDPTDVARGTLVTLEEVVEGRAGMASTSCHRSRLTLF